MPSETFTLINFFPSNRPISTLLSAAMIIPSADSISAAVSTFFAPPEPFVSALSGQPSFLPAFSSASAAMYVWAIPVGHAVTASTRYSVLAGEGVLTASSGYLSLSARSISAINVALSFAASSFARKLSSIRSTISLDRTSR